MKGQDPIRLILVRHGNTFESGQTPTQVGLRTDLPLTNQGREQAKAFAIYLEKEGIVPKAIYAGSLSRQIETAQIIGKNLNGMKNIHLYQQALDEIDYGAWEGLTSDEITERWPEQYTEWTEKSQWADGIFGGALQELKMNIQNWLTTLRLGYSSGDVVVGVTSNGIIRFFQSFNNENWQKLVNDKRMEDLKVKTGHFCELLLYKDSLDVTRWNVKP